MIGVLWQDDIGRRGQHDVYVGHLSGSKRRVVSLDLNEQETVCPLSKRFGITEINLFEYDP